MIDEVDKVSNNQIFLDFLGMLRGKYLRRRKEATFHGVMLVGVYDIKNIKLKLRPDEQRTYNNPWNIAASFNVDMTFTSLEISTMLLDYESEHHTDMDICGISDEIYRYTSGYPYLVSDICKIIDEQLDNDFTVSGVRRAVNITLCETNNLFDDIIKNIENNNSFKHFVRSILLGRMIEHRNLQDQQADIFEAMEGNMCVYRYGEISHAATVSENQSCYTMILCQLGRACILCI